MEDIILLDAVETRLDTDGNAHVIGKLDDEECEIGVIKNAMRFRGSELNERVMQMLAIEGFGIKPKEEPTPKPKRKYTRHVHLGLASEYGMITLNVLSRNTEPQDYTVYVLYVKGTNRYIYKITDKGVLACAGEKTKPLYFTKEDIKIIKNTDDFDIVKVVVKLKKAPKNKLAKGE